MSTAAGSSNNDDNLIVISAVHRMSAQIRCLLYAVPILSRPRNGMFSLVWLTLVRSWPSPVHCDAVTKGYALWCVSGVANFFVKSAFADG